MNLVLTIDGKEVVVPPYEVYEVRSAINEYISKRIDPKKTEPYELKEDAVKNLTFKG